MTRTRMVLVIAAALGAAVAYGATAPQITYFDARQVRAAFERGAVLFDQGTNYMVHASRRTEPGQAEVHTVDTDIIYVLEGASTFVTGGSVVGGTETAPNEMRGTAIEHGETRTIAAGDVIIVPAGTPHWFKEVRGPVLYYVVKVR